eukprot:tig00000334_g24110.t1
MAPADFRSLLEPARKLHAASTRLHSAATTGRTFCVGPAPIGASPVEPYVHRLLAAYTKLVERVKHAEGIFADVIKLLARTGSDIGAPLCTGVQFLAERVIGLSEAARGAFWELVLHETCMGGSAALAERHVDAGRTEIRVEGLMGWRDRHPIRPSTLISAGRTLDGSRLPSDIADGISKAFVGRNRNKFILAVEARVGFLPLKARDAPRSVFDLLSHLKALAGLVKIRPGEPEDWLFDPPRPGEQQVEKPAALFGSEAGKSLLLLRMPLVVAEIWTDELSVFVRFLGARPPPGPPAAPPASTLISAAVLEAVGQAEVDRARQPLRAT